MRKAKPPVLDNGHDDFFEVGGAAIGKSLYPITKLSEHRQHREKEEAFLALVGNSPFYDHDKHQKTHRRHLCLYTRVSTDDKAQDPENQLRPLRDWCTQGGHTIVEEYVEHVSGRKGASDRKELARLFFRCSQTPIFLGAVLVT